MPRYHVGFDGSKSGEPLSFTIVDETHRFTEPIKARCATCWADHGECAHTGWSGPTIKVPPAERLDGAPVIPELPIGGGLGISWRKALARIAERDPFLAEIAALHEPVNFVLAGKVYKPDCACSAGEERPWLWHECETAMILLRSVGLDVNDIDFQVGDARDGDEDGGSL